MDAVVKTGVLPKQELWGAVPPSGHILGVISVRSL